MSFVYLILGWIILTSLGIAAIVALEPLWTRRRIECPAVSAPRGASVSHETARGRPSR